MHLHGYWNEKKGVSQNRGKVQTWTEWKSDVKRKLAQNNAESKETGGGPFSKFQLTQTEEVTVRICGMTKSDVGVAGNAPGLPNERFIIE
ncbi:unnamed protein product [Ceratitis capitata]|uniref:(Mediterranean fruit fly) hypothetical protein n=1 Tax=Ceratitis capitata TaxID=7213 RepID=A0A811UYU4_CERCA|nr:unnamed protein product [Ceratitis capitata]